MHRGNSPPPLHYKKTGGDVMRCYYNPIKYTQQEIADFVRLGVKLWMK